MKKNLLTFGIITTIVCSFIVSMAESSYAEEREITFYNQSGEKIVLDNQKFLIKGDSPIETYNSINQSLVYAKENNIKNVKLPAGQYIISRYLQIPEDVSLQGTTCNGYKETIITNQNQLQPTLSLDSNMEIKDLKLDGKWDGKDVQYQHRGIVLTPFTDKEMVGGNKICYGEYQRKYNVIIQNMDITSFGGSGIYLDYAENVKIFGESKELQNKNSKINDIGYAGILAYSTNNSRVEDVEIADIGLELSQGKQAYGIAFSWHKGSTDVEQMVYEVSTHNAISNNLIYNIPSWEGIDTHSGKDIDIQNNHLMSIRFPIVVGGMEYNGSTIAAYPPEDITISKNVINGEKDISTINPRSDIASLRGIVATGTRNKTIQNADLGFLTGLEIVGNCVNNIQADIETRGGISIHVTKQASLRENEVSNSRYNGIVLMSSNKQFQIVNNLIKNISGSGSVGIGVRGSHNNGNQTNVYTASDPLTSVGTLIDGNIIEVTPALWVNPNGYNKINISN